MTSKKQLAFGALVTASIVVAPAIADAANLSFSSTDYKIYDIATVDLNSLPNNIVLTDYSWSVDNIVIADYNFSTLALTAADAGKDISVTATDSTGTTYTATTTVKPLTLEFEHARPSILDNASQSTNDVAVAFVGDTLKIGNLNLIDTTSSIILKPEDVAYTYQWYKSSSTGAVELIEGATEPTYTLTSDMIANETSLSIYAIVQPSIPGGNSVIDSTKTNLVYVPADDKPSAITTVEQAIQGIRTDTNDFYQYNIGNATTLEAFEQQVTSVQQQFDALTPIGKGKITNAAWLTTASADIQAIQDFSALYQQLIATAIPQEGTLNYEADVKIFKERADKTLKSFNTLSQLQLSLLTLTGYSEETVAKTIHTQYKLAFNNELFSAIFAQIMAINTQISDIFVIDGATNTRLEYALTFEELENELAQILASYSTVNTRYHSLIAKRDVTNAQKDLRLVSNFKNKALAINEGPVFTKKDISNAENALATYTKLTPLQKSLVPNEDLTKILNALRQEQVKVIDITQRIQGLTNSHDDTLEPNEVTFVLGIDQEPITATNFEAFEAHVNAIANDYNALSSTSKKFVTNYLELKETLTSIKETKRVNQIIANLLQYDPETNYSRTKSKLESAEKAFMSLSIIEQSLIFEKQTLLDYRDSIANNYPDELEEQASTIIDLIDSQLPILTNGYASYGLTDSIVGFVAVTNQVNNAYKAMPSKFRRSIHNYLALKTALKDVKSVNSMLKKIKAAESATGNLSQEFSRIATAERAYTKLSAAQQELIQLPYTEDELDSPYALLMQQKAAANEHINNLNQKIADLIQLEGTESDIPIINDSTKEPILNADGEEVMLYEEYFGDSYHYMFGLDYVKDLEKSYKNLGPTLQKYVIDKDRYTAAIKDAKLVEAFVKKVKKLPLNPTFEQKQSIVNAFYGLTAMQVSMLERMADESTDETYNIIKQYEQDVAAQSQLTLELTNMIDQIVVDGTYRLDFLNSIPAAPTTFIDGLTYIKNQYNAFTPTQKRLIFNYDVVVQAEKDYAAAKKMVDSYPAFTPDEQHIAWREELTTFNSLTMSLYKLIK